MTFTIIWYTCPNGRGTEPRIQHKEYLDNLCEAITYLRKKCVEAGSMNWDCGEVLSRWQPLYALDEDGWTFIIPRAIAWEELTDMTSRQKEIGVTVFGYLQGIIMSDFLVDDAAFLAIAGTLDKGRYRLEEVLNLWFGYDYTESEMGEVHELLSKLSTNKPHFFHYEDVYGVEMLTVM